MRVYSKFIGLLLTAALFACASVEKTATPLETLQSYTLAIKKKDLTTMKLLLSSGSIKMAEQEAKAQNVTLDEIVKRETLFGENQTKVEFRNEKVDGDKATIEMKDSFDMWNTVPFVKEEGVWKIDKQGIANQMMQGFDEKNRELDNKIKQDRIP